MLKDFNKIAYNSELGYTINHTTGFSAEGSTLSYLHQTPHYMLYYFIHGSGKIKIEGKNYTINDGDIIILNPAEMFCCSVDANKFHERIVLHFNENILTGFPQDCSALINPFINREKGTLNHISSETAKKYSLDILMQRLLFTIQNDKPAKEILALCKIIEVLDVLWGIFENKDSLNTARLTENPFVNKILEFLNAHFTEEINIEVIARNFNIDKSYLSHLFKEYVGTSVWNYVIFRRISCFNEIISKGMGIEEASQIVGFNNYSNFFRLYKKHTGITPMEYKKSVTNKAGYVPFHSQKP